MDALFHQILPFCPQKQTCIGFGGAEVQVCCLGWQERCAGGWWGKETLPSSKNVLKCFTDSAAGEYRPTPFNSEFYYITNNSYRACLLANGDVEVFSRPGCFGVLPLQKRQQVPPGVGCGLCPHSESGDFRWKRD